MLCHWMRCHFNTYAVPYPEESSREMATFDERAVMNDNISSGGGPHAYSVWGYMGIVSRPPEIMGTGFGRGLDAGMDATQPRCLEQLLLELIRLGKTIVQPEQAVGVEKGVDPQDGDRQKHGPFWLSKF